MNPETYLCFDYGEKRIGIAVGQTLTGTASPLETVTVNRNQPDWHRISLLIDEWKPAALVVGLPRTMFDGDQPLMDSVRRFARQLEGRYGLQVHLADERLTTYEARQRTGSDVDLDPVAAQVILETWLRDRQPGRAAGKTDE